MAPTLLGGGHLRRSDPLFMGAGQGQNGAGVETDRELLVGLVVDLGVGALRLTDSIPLIALALLSSASAPGASAERLKCGRRPIAAVRRLTIRAGTPGSSRLKEARYASSKAARIFSSLTPVVSPDTLSGSGTATVCVCPT